ncbi:hypothetical protein BH09PLA1_BH09PLA1_09900 [soil metagenome]
MGWSMTMQRGLSPAVTSLLAVIGITLLSDSAMATLLSPGATVAPGNTQSPNGASLIVDSQPRPFVSVDGTSFSGTLRTRVYTNDPGNPFGANALTFTYLLANNGPDALERLVTLSFRGYQVDVGVNNTPANGGVGGELPVSVDRSVTGKVVGWDWSGGSGVVAGGNSTLLVLHTNGIVFEPVTNVIINGSVATVSSFSPYFPEPTSMAVLSVATLGLLARRRLNPASR